MPSIVKNHTEKRPKNLKTWKSVLVCVLCLILSFIVTFAIFVSKNKHNVIKTSYIRKHPKSLLNNQDVFISVKTTQKNHDKRLQIVLDTWYQMAREHTYFFTDGKGDNLDIENGHLIVTQCGNSHSRQDLCCKMSAEFDAFLESNKK